jgi:four helix bundle protein
MPVRGPPVAILGSMQPFEELDAYRACHQLTLGMHRVVEKLEERDPELAAQLWLAALFATGRIARAAAFSTPRWVAMYLERTLGALSEMAYHLNLAHTLSLVSDEDHRELESLRGRAVFYTMKQLTTLSPGAGEGSA